MRESIGGTQLFIIVITLILLFSGIMALTINHSNAFTVKDKLVSIIEQDGGFELTADLDNKPNDTLNKIVESLQASSYRQKGKCPGSDDDYTVVGYERDGRQSSQNDLSSFCIVQIRGNSPVGTPQVYYYQVIVFYNLDLPVINSLFNFKAIGETKALYA